MTTGEPLPSAWYPTAEHPRGDDTVPCFEVLGTFVYPSVGHPSGPSSRPWYQLRGQYAYSVDGHPNGPSREPSFRIVDREVHPWPASGDTTPWFRIDQSPA